jgi:site-specific DNA recombinase
MANVTFIPAKHKIGNNVSGDEVTQSSGSQPTAESARIPTNRKQAMMHRSRTTQSTRHLRHQHKKRDEFNRMIDECMAGNIDMIITKSISRFARNTLDCLQYIRQLKDKNIPVYFEKESINTMDAKGEVLITIMASLAQQESQSLSQNVKLGLQYRYQQGKVQVNSQSLPRIHQG